MAKRTERILLFFRDFLTINAAYVAYYWLRIESEWFASPIQPELWLPMVVIYLYWLLLFAFFGLYRSWYAQSRLDELVTIFRTTASGVLVLFFLVFLDDDGGGPQPGLRTLIMVYWFLVLVSVSAGRLAIRSVQKKLPESGIGARNTVIVGWSHKAYEMCDMVLKYPALGYKIVGFATRKKARAAKKGVPKNYKGVPILGAVEQMPSLIRQYE